jgi:hypothetical protein
VAWVDRLKPVMQEEIKNARFDFLRKDAPGLPQSTAEYHLFFKLFVLARWQKVFGEAGHRPISRSL